MCDSGLVHVVFKSKTAYQKDLTRCIASLLNAYKVSSYPGQISPKNQKKQIGMILCLKQIKPIFKSRDYFYDN